VIKVAVVDDEALVRKGFQLILDVEPDIDVVGEAADGIEAVALATAAKPDVMLMDIRMPKLDGLEATRRILASGANNARIIILTTFDVDEYIFSALRAGASAFLLKDATAEQLVHAVRVVANGDALLHPVITRRLIDRFARLEPVLPEASEELGDLTSREQEVLRLVARGLSNAEIAQRLHVSDATVKSHVAHILMKLEVRDRVQAVILAYELGVVAPGGQ
jgi:DNA-binding NarL/FixJ family response regulator